MALIAHILIALTSVGFTTLVFFSPSARKLWASYGLVAVTLISGFYLVWSNPTHMLQACMSGLLYVGVVSLGLVSVHHKLADERNHTN